MSKTKIEGLNLEKLDEMEDNIEEWAEKYANDHKEVNLVNEKHLSSFLRRLDFFDLIIDFLEEKKWDYTNKDKVDSDYLFRSPVERDTGALNDYLDGQGSDLEISAEEQSLNRFIIPVFSLLDYLETYEFSKDDINSGQGSRKYPLAMVTPELDDVSARDAEKVIKEWKYLGEAFRGADLDEYT